MLFKWLSNANEMCAGLRFLRLTNQFGDGFRGWDLDFFLFTSFFFFCMQSRDGNQHLLLADGISYSFSADREIPASRHLRVEAATSIKAIRTLGKYMRIAKQLAKRGIIKGGRGVWCWEGGVEHCRRGVQRWQGKSTTSWRQLRLHKCMRMPPAASAFLWRLSTNCQWLLAKSLPPVVVCCCGCCSCHCCCCPNTTEVLKTFQCQVLAI